MQQVLFWYIMLGEGYFLTVYPEKEATDPKEVETTERTGGLFQVLLQLIFMYDETSAVLQLNLVVLQLFFV